MQVYKITVTVRAVVNVQANSDIEAGAIAYDYLEDCVKSGQATLPVPEEVRDIAYNTFVQAVTIHDKV